MKLNALFLVLLLIISIKSNDFLDSYSIEPFIKSMKDNGLFQIIQSIKYSYGKDVAIISCEELNKNYYSNCKKLVIEYMEEDFINKIEEIKNRILQSQDPEKEMEELFNYWKTIKNIVDMLDFSMKNLNLKELEPLYDKIKQRVENVYLNSTDDFLDFLDSSIKNKTKYLN